MQTQLTLSSIDECIHTARTSLAANSSDTANPPLLAPDPDVLPQNSATATDAYDSPKAVDTVAADAYENNVLVTYPDSMATNEDEETLEEQPLDDAQGIEQFQEEKLQLPKLTIAAAEAKATIPAINISAALKQAKEYADMSSRRHKRSPSMRVSGTAVITLDLQTKTFIQIFDEILEQRHGAAFVQADIDTYERAINLHLFSPKKDDAMPLQSQTIEIQQIAALSGRAETASTTIMEHKIDFSTADALIRSVFDNATKAGDDFGSFFQQRFNQSLDQYKLLYQHFATIREMACILSENDFQRGLLDYLTCHDILLAQQSDAVLFPSIRKLVGVFLPEAIREGLSCNILTTFCLSLIKCLYKIKIIIEFAIPTSIAAHKEIIASEMQKLAPLLNQDCLVTLANTETKALPNAELTRTREQIDELLSSVNILTETEKTQFTTLSQLLEKSSPENLALLSSSLTKIITEKNWIKFCNDKLPQDKPEDRNIQYSDYLEKIGMKAKDALDLLGKILPTYREVTDQYPEMPLIENLANTIGNKFFLNLSHWSELQISLLSIPIALYYPFHSYYAKHSVTSEFLKLTPNIAVHEIRKKLTEAVADLCERSMNLRARLAEDLIMLGTDNKLSNFNLILIISASIRDTMPPIEINYSADIYNKLLTSICLNCWHKILKENLLQSLNGREQNNEQLAKIYAKRLLELFEELRNRLNKLNILFQTFTPDILEIKRTKNRCLLGLNVTAMLLVLSGLFFYFLNNSSAEIIMDFTLASNILLGALGVFALLLFIYQIFYLKATREKSIDAHIQHSSLTQAIMKALAMAVMPITLCFLCFSSISTMSAAPQMIISAIFINPAVLLSLMGIASIVSMLLLVNAIYNYYLEKTTENFQEITKYLVTSGLGIGLCIILLVAVLLSNPLLGCSLGITICLTSLLLGIYSGIKSWLYPEVFPTIAIDQKSPSLEITSADSSKKAIQPSVVQTQLSQTEALASNKPATGNIRHQHNLSVSLPKGTPAYPAIETAPVSPKNYKNSDTSNTGKDDTYLISPSHARGRSDTPFSFATQLYSGQPQSILFARRNRSSLGRHNSLKGNRRGSGSVAPAEQSRIATSNPVSTIVPSLASENQKLTVSMGSAKSSALFSSTSTSPEEARKAASSLRTATPSPHFSTSATNPSLATTNDSLVVKLTLSPLSPPSAEDLSGSSPVHIPPLAYASGNS